MLVDHAPEAYAAVTATGTYTKHEKVELDKTICCQSWCGAVSWLQLL